MNRREAARLLGAALLIGALLWAPRPLECPEPDPALLRAQGPAVQLWAAPIDFLGGRAVHPHFTYVRAGEEGVHRVEIWQRAEGPGAHLWADRISPLHDQNMGLCLLGERTGADAEAVTAVLDAAAAGAYRWSGAYLAIPGPNSNSFAAAVLRASGWELALPRQAIGRRFPGWLTTDAP